MKNEKKKKSNSESETFKINLNYIQTVEKKIQQNEFFKRIHELYYIGSFQFI